MPKCKYKHQLLTNYHGHLVVPRPFHILETRTTHTHTRRRVVCQNCHKRWTDRRPLNT